MHLTRSDYSSNRSLVRYFVIIEFYWILHINVVFACRINRLFQRTSPNVNTCTNQNVSDTNAFYKE